MIQIMLQIFDGVVLEIHFPLMQIVSVGHVTAATLLRG